MAKLQDDKDPASAAGEGRWVWDPGLAGDSLAWSIWKLLCTFS